MSIFFPGLDLLPVASEETHPLATAGRATLLTYLFAFRHCSIRGLSGYPAWMRDRNRLNL